MTIYIESFLIQNILINFCLLKLVYLTSKSKTNFFRLLTASIVATIPSIMIVFFLNNHAVLNITKVISALLMLAIAFKTSKKQFMFNLILLFLYTYAFGGIISNFGSTAYHTNLGVIMTSKFSLELICLILIIFTYIFELIAKHIKHKIITSNLLYDITLTQSNNTIKISAYMDTGNFINHHGKPVLILDLEVYLKLTKTNLINFYTSKTEQLQTETINGKNGLKIFEIDEMKIKNGKHIIKLHNQIVAINTTNCFKNVNYQALLSPLFL